MGHSVKRKEDPRFIRGAGEYIDDVNLPGQLWLDIVRSPYAHATIKSIDASEALKVPGVLAVITGKDLEGYKLHWMPTLAGDMQMVLPTDTVMYQSQEVAAVIATTKYIAADGVAAVYVDYEPLEVVIDPYKALEAGAPVLRPDRGDGQAEQPHLALGIRRRGRGRCRARRRPRSVSARTSTSRGSTSPRSRRAAASPTGTRSASQLTLHMTSQAPHVIRTVLALVAAAPGCRSPSRTSGSRPMTSAAGSAARCRSTRATCSPSPPRSYRQAGEVDRGPLGEPAGGFVRPRLPHQHRARLRRRPARSRR